MPSNPYSSEEIPYQILISEEGLKRLVLYKNELSRGEKKPGNNLLEAIKLNIPSQAEKDNEAFIRRAAKDLKDDQFIQSFLQTREEYIAAEREGGGKKAIKENRWTKEEFQLSALMSLAMEVEVYDNGERRAEDIVIHQKPFKALMTYVSGTLNKEYADKEEINQPEKFYQLIESRLLPVFVNFNQQLESKGKQGFVTSPLLGCGAFGTDHKLFYQNFLKFLENNSSKFPNIRGVYLDDFGGDLGNEEKITRIGSLTLIKGAANFLQEDGNKKRRALLLDPSSEDYGEDFKDCILCNLVAWDPLSREGNEGRFDHYNRESNDPAMLRATNTLTITHNEQGSYDKTQKCFKLAREKDEETICSLQHQAGSDKILLQANRKNIRIIDKQGKVTTLADKEKSLPIKYSIKSYGFLGEHNPRDSSHLDTAGGLEDFIVVDPAGSAFKGDDGDLSGSGASGALYEIFKERPTYADEHNQNTQEFSPFKNSDRGSIGRKKVTRLQAGEAVFNDTYAKVTVTAGSGKPWGIIHAVGPDGKNDQQKGDFAILLSKTLKNVFFHYYELTKNLTKGQKPGLRIPLISGSIFLGDIKEEDYYQYFKEALEKGYNAALTELKIDQIDFGDKGVEVCCYGKEVKKSLEKAGTEIRSDTKKNKSLLFRLFNAENEQLAIGEEKVNKFNGEEDYRKKVSAYLREAARNITSSNPAESFDHEISTKNFHEQKDSPLVSLALGKAEKLTFPKILDGEEDSQSVISKEEFEKLKKQTRVFYSDGIEGVNDKYAREVLRSKSGISKSPNKEKANLITFILPTMVCYDSGVGTESTVGTSNKKEGIIQKTCIIPSRIYPPIAAKVFNFTYPKFNDPNAWEEETKLKTEVVENLREMLRLNILAVCSDYKEQEVAMPFILNPPAAFIRFKKEDSKAIQKQKLVKTIIIDELIKLMKDPGLSGIFKDHLSELIVLGGSEFWGQELTKKLKTEIGEIKTTHIVNADIIDIAKKLKGNPATEGGQLLIPMMGEPLGGIGNGALGDMGNSALDEDLFRRCLGIHAALGNCHLNPSILDNIKPISSVISDLESSAKLDSFKNTHQKIFDESEIEGGQIIRTKPGSSPIPVASIRSGFVNEGYFIAEDRFWHHITGPSVQKNLNTEEITQKSSDIARLVINKSFSTILGNKDNLSQNRDQAYWDYAFLHFEGIIKHLVKEKEISENDTGKNAGFQAWKDDIQKIINENPTFSSLDPNQKENLVRDFKLISKTIQEEATNYFGSALGRKYNKSLDGKEIGARSYRIIQLLDGDNSLKFQPNNKTGRGR